MSNRLSIVCLVFFVFLFVFAGCSLSDDEKADVIKILEIREELLNKGDVKSLRVLLAENFPERTTYLNQIQYQQQYFSRFSYDLNTIDFLPSLNFFKKAVVKIDYDISYKDPNEVAEVFWLDRKEEVVLVKEKIGWKIAEIKEDKDSGRKIDSKTVHNIFSALETRQSALNNGDFELFETVIDISYPEREVLLENFKKNLLAFTNVNYGLKGREFQYISQNKDEARVVQFFDLVFNIKGLDQMEKVQDQREIISVKLNKNGLWQITDGLK